MRRHHPRNERINVGRDRKECRCKGLAAFRPNLPRVLKNGGGSKIDMFEREV